MSISHSLPENYPFPASNATLTIDAPPRGTDYVITLDGDYWENLSGDRWVARICYRAPSEFIMGDPLYALYLNLPTVSTKTDHSYRIFVINYSPNISGNAMQPCSSTASITPFNSAPPTATFDQQRLIYPRTAKVIYNFAGNWVIT